MMKNAAEQNIHEAASTGNVKRVKEFLKAGVNVDTPDPDGWTALHFAANNGDIALVNALLKAGARVNAKTRVEEGGDTPLHLAALSGHTEVASALLKAGAKVDARDNRGNTPLHAASVWRYRGVIEVLIAAGARIEAHNNDFITPLTIATQAVANQTIQSMNAINADFGVLELLGAKDAARSREAQVLQVLLDRISEVLDQVARRVAALAVPPVVATVGAAAAAGQKRRYSSAPASPIESAGVESVAVITKSTKRRR